MSSNYSLGGIGGFNSGFDVNSIISQLMAMEQRPIDLMEQKKRVVSKQQAAYTSVQNKVKSLLTAIDTLTRRDIIDNKTIFENMKATSSDNKSVSASVSNSAAPQTLSVEVISLPTSTIATSMAGIGRFDEAMTLDSVTSNASKDIKEGFFTLYSTDGGGVTTATQINVTLASTFGDIFSQIEAAVPGADVSIVNGKIQLDYSGSTANQVTLGAGGDTSDFLAKTFLNTGINNGAKVLTASQPVSSIERDIAVTDPASNLATTVNANSEFIINGVTFNADGKSLNTLIDEINKSNANVTAYFNRGTNKFEIVSNDPGNTLINLQDQPGGNFLTAMNLVNGSGSVASQVAGTNARFKLNGVEMYSTSATVDETITGLTGVSLNLKKVAPGVTTQITIQKDTDALVNQVEDIINKYNAVIDEIAKQTKIDPKATETGASASNGPLAGNSSIKNFRNQLRAMFTQSVGGDLANTAFESLQMVGISSSPKAIGSSSETETGEETEGEDGEEETTKSDSDSASTAKADGKLYLDKAALKAALALDPDKLKRLFIAQDLAVGAPGVDDGLDGTFTKIHRLLADDTYTDGTGRTGFGVLYNLNDGAKGMFAAYQTSAGNRIKTLEESIQRATDRLAIKEKTLRQQYLAMDKLVGQYQRQGMALGSLQSFRSS